MTVPLFPIIVTDPLLNIFGVDSAAEYRNWMLTTLFVTYSFAQLVGAPFFGGLSDKYGRKKILAFIFIVNIVQYFLIALSVMMQSYTMLLITRITAGFAGGTVFIQQSAIADLSTKENKAKNLGIVGVAFGIGLILGPLIGTWLADANNHPSFSLATPFFAILGLNALNLILLFVAFKESLTTFYKKSFSLLDGFKNIYIAFSMPNWRILFIATSLLSAGLFFFLQFFQVMLEQKFNYGVQQQGITLAFCGLIMVFSQGFVLPRLSKVVKVERLLLFALPTMAVAFLFIAFSNSSLLLYLSLALFITAQGICTPGLLSLISNKAEKNVQGATIGINQSIQSFSSALPALLTTSLVNADIRFPMFFGFAATILALVIYYVWEYRTEK